MLVDVVLLRRRGVRLRAPELEQPVRGHLSLSDQDGRASSFKRPMRVAHLHEVTTGQVAREILLPLCDAEVILIEGETFSITGIELESAKDPATGTMRIAEHGQVWRCTVVRP